MDFTGKNVANVTLKKQSDVVIRKILSTVATVTVAGDTLEPGQVLVTVDGGETFNVADETAEPNGILCEALEETGEAEVLILGTVRKKYLTGLDEAHNEHLFNNKIILR